MTAKEIFLELLKPDGKPERQLVQYKALQMALGDPIGGYLHMGRMPGVTITDRWGTVIEWPADAPGSMPLVTDENNKGYVYNTSINPIKKDGNAQLRNVYYLDNASK